MIDIEQNNSERWNPLNVVMVFLASAVLAGGFLLLSAAESTTPVDGAVEWHAESPLRAVVQLLCLDYRFPTINAGEIKGYILGLGSGIGILALGIAAWVRPRTEDELPPSDIELQAEEVPTREKGRLTPLAAAQFLALLYVLWSFASSRWSSAPDLAIGGSLLLAISWVWSFGLGYGLNAPAARSVARILVYVTALTAVVALWYYYGRNPTLRAKFPFGNPTFLAAAMLPGALLSLSMIVAGARSATRIGGAKPVIEAAAGVVCLSLSLWTLTLADSRAAYLGFGVGAAAMACLTLPRRWRWAIAGIGVLGAGVAWASFSSFATDFSSTGRSATLRLRTYAWSYAWRMFTERPLTGYGQGAFAMLGDSYAADDVLSDPPVFESRIDHAHCEWLEVMSDIGIVGAMLLAATVIFTVHAVTQTLDREKARPNRATLVGLLGGLTALLVQESFGVGLRVCEIPLVFHSVVGLLWSFPGDSGARLRRWVHRSAFRGTASGAAGVLAAAGILVLTQHDFRGARFAFRTDELIQQGDLEAAVRAASSATDRLSPQRVLQHRFRLAQTHVLAAERLADRAGDRERRARESDPPNPNLRLLAGGDFNTADEHCRAASHAIKELVSAAPGYINHGWLESRINLLEARSAAFRGDSAAPGAYVRNAVAALERELKRQPFDPGLAVDALRAVGPNADPDAAMTILARPLRYNRITDSYVNLLGDLLGGADFARGFERNVGDAAERLLGGSKEPTTGAEEEDWAAERLRLGATVDFLRGLYGDAVRKLEIATIAYERVAADAPLGAASVYAELADCRFYADPDHPQPAVDSARRAIELAPDSRVGRELRTGVRQRLIHYRLAADNEVGARELLRELVPANVSSEVVDRELGVRLRRLCESLLQRRETEHSRKPAETLLPKLERWLVRSRELNPDDPATYFLAADMAFYRGDIQATAERLQEALRRGLPQDEARRFLQMALTQRPDAELLRRMVDALPAPAADRPSPP